MSVNRDVTVLQEARVSFCGNTAVLLDAEGPLALATQERIWRLSDKVRQWEGVVDTQPGMNSLLVVVDPKTADLEALAARLSETWPTMPSGSPERVLRLRISRFIALDSRARIATRTSRSALNGFSMKS